MGEIAPAAAPLDRKALAELRLRLAGKLRARAGEPATGAPRELLVCAGGACISCHSLAIADELESALAASGLTGRVRVVRVGCMGLCDAGPLVVVSPDGVYYQKVDRDGARRIVTEHLGAGRVVRELELAWDAPDGRRLVGREVPFFAQQVKIALRNCGVVDPAAIEEYVARDGYLALEKALFEADADDVVADVKSSRPARPRRRGFPEWLKWQIVPCGARRRSTSSATATRATRARSWTAACSRATPTASSRA